jgi:hypothetical protein
MNRKMILGWRLLGVGFLSLFSLYFGARLLWNSTSSSGAGGGTPTPEGVLWIPSSGGGGGFSPFVPSSDEITYSTPRVFIAGKVHPLSTAAADLVITQAESGLMQSINAYRSQRLNENGGGLRGAGAVIPPANAFLQGHEGLMRNARANCKHFALYHPGPFATTNPEGDAVNGGGGAPAGRLAKTGITAGGAQELLIAGPQYSDYNIVADVLISTFGDALADLQWTHFGCGYWTGGHQRYYWSVILAWNPRP